MPVKYLPVLLAFLTLGLGATHAYGSMAEEVELLSKSIKYIKGIESGGEGLTIGVVYSKGSAASLEQAELFVRELSASDSAKTFGLTPELIAVEDLEKAPDLQLAYVSSHLNKHFGRIYQYAREHKIFTVSTDKSCVETRCCILSFDGSAGLNIFLNQSNLRALGFGINAAFKFMVRRV